MGQKHSAYFKENFGLHYAHGEGGSASLQRGSGAEPPVGSKEQNPWWGSRGLCPPEADRPFVFLTSHGAAKFVFFCILQCLVGLLCRRFMETKL